MRTLILCVFISFFFLIDLAAQYRPMDIPLTKNGINLQNGWAGGLDLPQFSELDLNNDGIQDLVVYDRSGHIASTFINNGTVGRVDYDYAPEYMKRFPQQSAINFMLLRDYNCDGIEDIFMHNSIAGQGIGLAVWEASYDANDTIQFTLIDNQLGYYLKNGNPLKQNFFIYNTDLPAIDDVDGDGDIDLLFFTIDFSFGNHIHWYKNMSVENGRGCDSLEYVLETQCWGLFEEIGDSNRVNFGPSIDSCYNNPYFNLMQHPDPNMTGSLHSTASNARNGRHVGASTTIVDFNGDSTLDMTLGSVGYTTTNMVSGLTIYDTVLINTQDYYYPVYDKPIDIYSFPSTFFLDVNNDGKEDMLVAPSEKAVGESIRDSVAWYYENTGTNNNMIFDFQQKDFLVGEMLDVGENAFPVLLDYNADGLMDLLVGGFGRCQYGGSYEYGMTLLENTGTLTNPSFEYMTNNYAGTDSLQLHGLYPTVGDLDGDGDVDMICGSENGTLSYFENTAGSGNPVVWNAPVPAYFNIDVGNKSAPQLIDLDRDLDLDLVIGRYGGLIHYYENTGSATNPIFSSTPVTNALGGYSLQNFSRSPMPFVYDNNGAYELFIGHQLGNMIQLGNIDGNLLGTYDTLSENFNDFYQGYNTNISIADLNNDNKLDYILGTGRGGVILLEERSALTTTVAIEKAQKVVHLYPNPAQDALNISFLNPNSGTLHMTVYNALGQVVLQTTTTSNKEHYEMDISKLATGVLFLEIRAENYQEVVQFVKL